MPSYFPEGDTPYPSDNEVRSLQKIVSLGGGGGSASLTVGTGGPAPASGASGDLFWDETNKQLYVKDVDGWNIH